MSLSCWFFVYEAVTLYGSPFQNISTKRTQSTPCSVSHGPIIPTTPSIQHKQVITYKRFRLFPFRSPLFRESLRFLFLALLRCFSSRRLPHAPIYSAHDILGSPRWVPPFGHFRINASFQLPETYRRFARPSSPIDAKASTNSS